MDLERCARSDNATPKAWLLFSLETWKVWVKGASSEVKSWPLSQKRYPPGTGREAVPLPARGPLARQRRGRALRSPEPRLTPC